MSNWSVKYKKWCDIQLKPRERIFKKGYGFLPFAKNMGKNIGNNVSKNLNGEASDHAKQSATDALKTTSKRAIQKTAEAAGDFIGNKFA